MRLGVTDQTVMNYMRRGMPAVGRSGTGRRAGWIFDLAECEKWVADNCPQGKGGRRDGAGRKSAASVGPAAGGGESGEAVGAEAAAVFGESAKHSAVLADLARGDDVIALVHRHKMTQSLARTLKDAAEAQLKVMETRTRMGELVEAADVRAAMVLKVAAADAVLTNLPALIAAELAARLKLDATGQETARQLVKQEVERARAALAKV